MSDNSEHVNKQNIIDSMYYWLGKSRPFYINGEYKLTLLYIDKVNNSAKIEITNLKNKDTQVIEHSIEVDDAE